MICRRCNWYAPDDCTCRVDEATWKRMWLEVQARHQDAVKRARVNDYRRRLRADRELRRTA